MTLETQIKQMIIDSLGLEDITAEDIDTDAPCSVTTAWGWIR